jgi:hypothetical protein
MSRLNLSILRLPLQYGVAELSCDSAWASAVVFAIVLVACCVLDALLEASVQFLAIVQLQLPICDVLHLLIVLRSLQFALVIAQAPAVA